MATQLTDPRLTQWKQEAVVGWHMSSTVNQDKTTGIGWVTFSLFFGEPCASDSFT